jgi:hypothetical protein
MQLPTADETLRLDTSKYTQADWAKLAGQLQQDSYNIETVAKHVRQLLAHDKLGRSLPSMSEYEVKIVGARYNRGVSASLDNIEKHTSYGDFIVRR